MESAGDRKRAIDKPGFRAEQNLVFVWRSTELFLCDTRLRKPRHTISRHSFNKPEGRIMGNAISNRRMAPVSYGTSFQIKHAKQI